MKLPITNYQLPITQSGQAVITFVVFILFVSLIVISGFSATVLRGSKISGNLFKSKQSYFLAEAGIEDALYRVKKGKNYSVSETLFLNGGEANVSVSDIFGGDKEISSIGDVLDNIRKINVLLSTAVGVEFFYGAQVGEGGLIMGQNAGIEGAGGAIGNVYSNGSIIGANGATITGDATVATGISEDNQARSTVCSAPPDGDQKAGQSDPQIDLAQSFSPSASKPLAKISLYIKKTGNPGDRSVYITTDQGGSPSDTHLSQGTLYSSLVGENYAWVDVTFPEPASLAEGQMYWIVLDALENQNKYWVWCKDKNQGYGNGVAKYSEDWDDDPWTLIVGDLAFKTYLGAGFSSIESVEVGGTARANTITDSHVFGDAYFQTLTSTIVEGTQYPDSDDPPIANMPISQANIDQWEADALVGGTITGNCGDGGSPECTISDEGTLSLGPKKIDGNLILTKKQTLVVSGTLHFTGYLDINSAGGATIKCDPSYGTRSCIIMTDSWVKVRNNSIFEGSGQPGSYIMILTTLSGCNGGSQLPQCTDYNSAVNILNNASGAIFYSPYSMVHISNGVQVTEVTAYKLELDNTASVIYEEGLINSMFSSGPGGSFSIEDWSEI